MEIGFSRVRWGWILVAGLVASVLICIVFMLFITTAYTISMIFQMRD